MSDQRFEAAKAAMQALIQKLPEGDSAQCIADWGVKYADALLAELDKTNKQKVDKEVELARWIAANSERETPPLLTAYTPEAHDALMARLKAAEDVCAFCEPKPYWLTTPGFIRCYESWLSAKSAHEALQKPGGASHG